MQSQPSESSPIGKSASKKLTELFVGYQAMARILWVFDRGIQSAVVAGLSLASLLLLLMAVFGAADVAAINVLGQSIPIVSELSADALAVVIFLAVAVAQQRRQHVSVELFTHLLPSILQRVLTLAALLITLGFFSVLTWRTWVLAEESWELQQTAMALYPYPVYPFKIAVLVGTVLATLETLRQTIRYLTGQDSLSGRSGGIAI